MEVEMPEEIHAYDFYCPKCGEKPSVYNSSTTHYSMQKLNLPYFMCGDCRICGYDKKLIRTMIHQWDKHSHAISHFNYKKIYLNSIRLLEERTAYYVKTAGYRISEFKLKKSDPPA